MLLSNVCVTKVELTGFVRAFFSMSVGPQQPRQPLLRLPTEENVKSDHCSMSTYVKSQFSDTGITKQRLKAGTVPDSIAPVCATNVL